MSNFNRIYKSILVEGRVPSIFRKATPEEVAERKVKWGKIQLDEWMEEFLKRKDIRKNKDGSWDVDGMVKIIGMETMTRFPVRFGKITGGGFHCGNCGLTTLEGAPTTVAGGDFSCWGCTRLTTLEGAPTTVAGGDFSCWGCTRLTTLEGAPKTVTGGGFYCGNCRLTTLEGAPRTITGGNFNCGGCAGLTTLEGAPTTVTDGWFSCANCRSLTTLKGAPRTVTGGYFSCWGCGREFTVEEVMEHCDVTGNIYVNV